MTVYPPRLKQGDTVRLVSPASTPTHLHVEHVVNHLKKLGLNPEIGKHVFDRVGYLAGTDENRLADINDAIKNSEVKAIIATRGGKGAYRIADKLDFEGIRAQPKLLVGFSEITILHLALYKHCQLAGLHGAAWFPPGTKGLDGSMGVRSAASFEDAIFTGEPILVQSDASEPTASLTTKGSATGILIGGNQDMLATAAGWMLPDLDGAVLLLEAFGLRLGQMDRQLTMLENSGRLKGIKGIAIGQYTECGPDATTQGDWTAIDVLRYRLGRFDVPILGGLSIGHGENPIAVPVGTMAHLNADAGTLEVSAAVV